MRLIDIISSHPESTTLVELSSRTLNVSDLANLPKLPKGHSVLIASTDIIETLILITALDGLAERIGFCSPSLSEKEIDRITQSGEFDYVLSSIKGSPIHFSTAIEIFADIRTRDKQCEQPNSLITKWVMTTSGTTGQPKLVEHTLNSLTSSTKPSSNISTQVKWGLLYDFTRFAGMQVVLQSLYSGSTMVLPNARDSLVSKVIFMSEKSVTHLSATPTLWRNILMTPDHIKMPIKVATLGGEIADQAILDALKMSYPRAHIIHIYASTEAGVGFSVKDGKEGFPATLLSSSLNHVDLRISDSILEIRNTHVGKKYIGTNDKIADEDSWISTGDLIETKENRILFMGRANGTINVGGNKVIPEIIESTIQKHPSVLASRVYSRKNPFSGSLVVADIVLEQNCKENNSIKSELKTYLKDKLEAYQVPAIIKIVETIRTNASGKIERKNI